LQPFFGLPTVPIRVTDHDITDIVLGGGPGVRVTGKIVSPGTPPNAMPLQTLALTGAPTLVSTAVSIGQGGVVSGGGGTLTSISTRTNSDGTFEFLVVPPGIYTVRLPGVAAFTSQAQTLVVADKEISGLQFNVPYQTEVPGHVVMEDGSRFQMASSQPISLEARTSNSTYGTSIAADGSFRFRLSEGSYQIGMRNFPLGFAVKSISSGEIDVLKASLKIAPGETLKDIVVTVATVPLDSIKGVKFSGRIIGLEPGSASLARVGLAGSDQGGYVLETTPNSDGSFEFPKVPPGNYQTRITGVPNAALGGASSQRIYVGDDNVSGFQIPLSIRTMVTGRITVVDANGRPAPDAIPSGSVTFRRQNGTSGTSLAPDGTFRIPLDDGDSTITIDRLPSQFTIQSITAGSVDMMKESLKVDHNAQIPEIQVRMVYRP